MSTLDPPTESTFAAPPVSLGFHAMPDSPHLTRTHCGYTMLALRGLSEEITSDQVGAVSINGFAQQWRAMNDRTLMIIPAFLQEAQRVVIEFKVPAGVTALKPFKTLRATVTPPDQSMGLTPPKTRREACQ